MHRLCLVLTLSAALLTACATPTAPPAPFAAPTEFKEQGLWQRVQTAGNVDADWWRVYADPVLNDLVQRLERGNESLKGTAARAAAARAALDASRAAHWPTVSASLSGARSQSSPAQTPANNAVLSFSAQWEVDLWGRLSSAERAAQAGAAAGAGDLAAARLSLQAGLVQTYLALRTAEAQQTLMERSVAAYQRSLDLSRDRHRAGVAAQTDVLSAQTQLKTAQAQVVEYGLQRSQYEHAIAALLGLAPAEFTLARSAQLPRVPQVPKALPSTLLQRRPDIAAAAHRVTAAYAQIDIADAAFFPSLSLSAGPGYRSSALSNLLTAPNRFWSIGPTLAQSLFDGGSRRASLEQARANAEQATAGYRQTVLTALQEVEDNLVMADQLQTESQFQREALQAAQRNLEMVLEQYRAGTVGYLNVVAAQTAALASERNLAELNYRELSAVNQLLKNLAGGW